jgi:hypothetical protein
MQRSGFLPIDVRLIHPYPTLTGRRDAVRAFDVVLSDATRQFRLTSRSTSAASRFSIVAVVLAGPFMAQVPAEIRMFASTAPGLTSP